MLQRKRDMELHEENHLHSAAAIMRPTCISTQYTAVALMLMRPRLGKHEQHMPRAKLQIITLLQNLLLHSTNKHGLLSLQSNNLKNKVNYTYTATVRVFVLILIAAAVIKINNSNSSQRRFLQICCGWHAARNRPCRVTNGEVVAGAGLSVSLSPSAWPPWRNACARNTSLRFSRPSCLSSLQVSPHLKRNGRHNRRCTLKGRQPIPHTQETCRQHT